MLADLSDQRLQAFQASQRQEQVLKDKEALIGRDGKPIYENRYNAPQVVASGSALVGDDGSALYTNTPPPEAPKPTATMQDYQFARQNGFQGSFLDYQKAVNESKRGPGVTVNTGEQGPKIGTIPQGYQAIAGEGGYEMSVVPGGPADQKSQISRQKAQGAMDTFNRATDTTIESIEKAISQTNGVTAGLASLSAALPGTPARDLFETLQTIKANVGFNRLEEMRANSETGGALGQVTERELDLLAAVNGAIDNSQSPDQLRENLALVRERLAQARAARQNVYDSLYGDQPQRPLDMVPPSTTQASDRGSQQRGRARYVPGQGVVRD
jgi:hypothetical protein